MKLGTTRDTAMTSARWCNGFGFAGSPVSVLEGSMGLVVRLEVYK